MPPRRLQDLERDPKNVRYAELLRILREHGCAVREGKRMHTVVKCDGRTVTIPRHEKVVKPVYVRLAIRAVRGEAP